MCANFHRYYESWFDQLGQFRAQLALLPKTHPHSPNDSRCARELVDKTLSHYAAFYHAKSVAACSDVLSLFSSPWASSLERSLHWVAGFRPTTVFHLIYTETSIRFESHMVDILRGHRTGDLGELTPSQLARVSELQCETVKEENEISNELGAWQDEVFGLEWAGVGCGGGVEAMLVGLVSVVEKADELRMRTLRKVVELLTPQQAVEFLVAAAELQAGIRCWGLHQDRQRGLGL